MKRVLILFGCIAVLTIFYAGYSWVNYVDRSTLQYIDKITGVKLPSNIAIISEFDNGEWITGGKYRIETRDMNSFLADHPFQEIKERLPLFSHYNIFDKANKIPPADSASLIYFTGCKPGNTWLFTLNKKTGELWVEVQYPDWGGTAPGCPL